MMALAEFSAVVDKRLAWRVLLKGGATLITAGFAVFSALIVPVLYVNNLSSRVDSGNERADRLETQVTDLTRSLGEMKIQMAEFRSEVKATRGDSAEIKTDLKLLLQQRTNAPPARTANVPTRRTQ